MVVELIRFAFWMGNSLMFSTFIDEETQKKKIKKIFFVNLKGKAKKVRDLSDQRHSNASQYLVPFFAPFSPFFWMVV